MRDTDWEIIYELYQEQNITKVAEKLYITQPALTKRLRAIEDEFGVVVAERTKKGIIFTPEGEILARRAKEYLRFINSTKNEMKAYQKKNDGEIYIGAAYTYSKEYLNDEILSYTNKNSNINIHVTNEPSNVLFRQMQENAYDLAFVQGDYVDNPPRLKREIVATCAAYILSKESIDIADLKTLKRIEYQSNDKTKELFDGWWYENFGEEMESSLFVTHIDFAWELVERGVGYTVCFMPEHYREKLDVHWTAIKDKNGKIITRNTWMVYDPTNVSEAAKNFIEYIKLEKD